MVASDLNAAHKQFKQAFDKGDAAACTTQLGNLKLLLAKGGALGVDEAAINASSKEDLTIARDVLEMAVVLGIKQQDESLFERNYAQLRTLYAVSRYEVGMGALRGAALDDDTCRQHQGFSGVVSS